MKNIKKIAIYSLLAPIFVVIFRLSDIYQQINLLGLNGIYDCQISFPKHCSIWEYLFIGDDAIIMYAGMFASFVGLFLLIMYISFLVRLYKDNKHIILYKVLAVTVLMLIALYFIITYIQMVS